MKAIEMKEKGKKRI